MYNRLKSVGKYEHPTIHHLLIKSFIALGFKTFKIAGVYLFPLGDVKTKNAIGFTQSLTPLHKKVERIYTKQLKQRY